MAIAVNRIGQANYIISYREVSMKHITPKFIKSNIIKALRNVLPLICIQAKSPTRVYVTINKQSHPQECMLQLIQ